MNLKKIVFIFATLLFSFSTLAEEVKKILIILNLIFIPVCLTLVMMEKDHH